MAYCMKCGAQLPENAAVCPQCGAPTGAAAGAGQQQSWQQPAPEKTDFTEDFAPEDRNRLRWILALGYISPVFLLFPMLAYGTTKLVRFHLNQSLCLLVLVLVSGIVMIVPFAGWVVGGVGCGFWLVLTIIDIVRTLKQEARWTPLIGKYVVMPVDD